MTDQVLFTPTGDGNALFYGSEGTRRQPLALLKEVLENYIVHGHSLVASVYGTRGVGKTSLITHAINNVSSSCIVINAIEANVERTARDFTQAIQEVINGNPGIRYQDVMRIVNQISSLYMKYIEIIKGEQDSLTRTAEIIDLAGELTNYGYYTSNIRKHLKIVFIFNKEQVEGQTAIEAALHRARLGTIYEVCGNGPSEASKMRKRTMGGVQPEATAGYRTCMVAPFSNDEASNYLLSAIGLSVGVNSDSSSRLANNDAVSSLTSTFRYIGYHPGLLAILCDQIEHPVDLRDEGNVTKLLEQAIIQQTPIIEGLADDIIKVARKNSLIWIYLNSLIDSQEITIEDKSRSILENLALVYETYDESGNNVVWRIPEVIRYRIRVLSQGERVVLDSVIQTASVVVIWLWPYLQPGANALVSRVGEKLGDTFANNVGALITEVRSKLLPDQRDNIEAAPANFESEIRAAIREVWVERQSLVLGVGGNDVWGTVRRLLITYYSDVEIRTILADIGVSADAFGISSTATKQGLALQLTEYAKTRGLLANVVESMKQQNSYPFQEQV